MLRKILALGIGVIIIALVYFWATAPDVPRSGLQNPFKAALMCFRYEPFEPIDGLKCTVWSTLGIGTYSPGPVVPPGAYPMIP